MRRDFARLSDPAGARHWLGVNYWSRAGGPLMWRTYDPRIVAEELSVLAAHGLGVTRSFFYWPDFMPTSDAVREVMVDRYADFLDRHVAAGMRTIPTFLVGHMSGENWDPPWRDGRDLYADTWMVARQAWFVREMTARFAGHPAVAGWLISNEMPIYGGAADRAQVSAWAELMVQAVRAGGGTQPVSIGDGAWGREVTGQDNGYSVRALAGITDFVGPHVYPMSDDLDRQHYTAALHCELAAAAGRPVVLEEFGCSTDFAADDNAGHYYRQVLHTSLLAGATGWLAWNNTDYDELGDQDPYRHHPFEMHFGITTSSGAPKAPARELADFAETLRTVDVDACTRLPTDTALVVSSYLDADYPFSERADADQVYESVRQAYIAAREADLAPGLVREADGVPSGYRLYLVPSVKQLTVPTWRRLAELAEGGATVFVSYSPGTHRAQRGPWYADLNGLFGVEHRLRYGVNDPLDGAAATVRFTADLGDLAAGEALTFAVAGGAEGRAFLPVRPDGAQVLAVGERDRPVLLRHQVGDGAVVLCTYPIEQMAAATPRVNPEDTGRLYGALAVAAGVRRPVRVADPRVSVDGLRHAGGHGFVWLINHADEQVSVVPQVADGGRLSCPWTGDGVGTVTLGPFGVRVVRMDDRETKGEQEEAR